MNIAYSRVITVTKNGSLVHMSFTDKENQTGLLWNERLFFVSLYNYFGYLRSVDSNLKPEDIDLTQAKVTIALKDLVSIQQIKPDKILLEFHRMVDSKKESCKWLLRFKSAYLTRQWNSILSQALLNRNKTLSPALPSIVDNLDQLEPENNQRQPSQSNFEQVREYQQPIKAQNSYNNSKVNLQIQISDSQKLPISAINRNSKEPQQSVSVDQETNNYLQMISRVLAQNNRDEPIQNVQQKLLQSHFQYLGESGVKSRAIQQSFQRSLSKSKIQDPHKNQITWFQDYLCTIFHQSLEDQSSLMLRFGNHCEKILKQHLLNQMPVDNDIEMRLFTIPLTKDKLCDMNAYEHVRQAFNNLKACKKNILFNQRVIVPLMCLIESNGYIALFRTKVNTERNYKMTKTHKERLSLPPHTICDFYQINTKNYNKFVDPEQAKRLILLGQISSEPRTDIEYLSKCLNQGAIILSHPADLQFQLQKHCTSLKCLLPNITYPYLHQFLVTDIAARCVTALIYKLIQDQPNHDNLSSVYLDIINCVLGTDAESQAIWNLMNAHSQYFFKISVSRNSVLRGLFVVCLFYHCSIEAEMIPFQEIFKKQHCLTNVVLKNSKIKYLDPINLHHSVICQFMAETQVTQSDFDRAASILKLKNNQIPLYYNQNNFIWERICQKISLFIPPFSELSTKLKLYEYSKYPTRANLNIRLQQLKWYFKSNIQQQYLRCCDDYILSVSQIFGDFHPAYTVLYITFSRFHASKDEFEDAITFAKSAIVNSTKIMAGKNHITLIQCYQHLAQCYLLAQKTDSALVNFQKCQHMMKDLKIPTYPTEIQIALINFSKKKFSQSLVQLQKCISALEYDEWSKLQAQQIVKVYEVMYECYKRVGSFNHSQLNVSIKCGKPNLLNIFVGESHLFQRIIKLAVQNIFSKLTPSTNSMLRAILIRIPQIHSNNSYSRAYLRLRSRLQNNQDFIKLMLNYIENIVDIRIYIDQNTQLLQQWMPLAAISEPQTVKDFICLSQQLMQFVGRPYFFQKLQNSLNLTIK